MDTFNDIQNYILFLRKKDILFLLVISATDSIHTRKSFWLTKYIFTAFARILKVIRKLWVCV